MAEAIDIRALNERIERESAFVTNLMTGMDQVIVGQKHLVESLLIGLLSDGHILLEGVPGLAKTLAIKTLASLIDSKYSRVQFTPDLLPADILGTMIYSQKDERFVTNKGPIFANFILADEINRAPAKVQSALLEAMQERQVTLGKETTISTMDGEFYAHLHISAGNEKGEVFGGHLNRAVVSATCEMVITVIPGVVDRRYSEEIGLNLFQF